MRFRYRIEGLKDVERSLFELADIVGHRRALTTFRRPLTRVLKPTLTAIEARTPVDTGTLRDSVGMNVTRPTRKELRARTFSRRSTIIVARVGYFWRTQKGSSEGSLRYHSLAVEYGNRKVKAYQVLRRIFRKNVPTIVRDISRELDRAFHRRLVRARRGLSRV